MPNDYEYIGSTFECPCGKVHTVPIKAVVVEPDANLQIPSILEREIPGKKGLLIADDNTYRVAGSEIEALLKDKGFQIKTVLLTGMPIVKPDEKAVMQILCALEPDMDFLVAVGSGTINDTTRFISHKTGIPYMIAATAPSMDGYASTVSPMLVNGFKRTFPAASPFAIVGDTRILCKAPMDMILAGFGDILGKLTSIADWKLGIALLGEACCKTAMDMVSRAVDKVLACASGLKDRREEGIKALMEALVLSGIAMMLSGNSRPASGAEHHIAHYLEMKYFLEGREPLLHGTKVGMAVSFVAALYEHLSGISPDSIDIPGLLAERPSYEAWAETVSRVYGPLAPEVLEEIGKGDFEGRVYEERLTKIKEVWNQKLLPVMKAVPGAERIRAWAKEAGADFSPRALGVDRDLIREALLHAKEVRPRYTVLRLASDIGILNKQLIDKMTALL